MATAEELLANDQCTDILWIDLDSRIIDIPNTVTNIGVESDDSVLKLHFGMKRHYHGIDLSEFAFRINYDNALGEGDVYTVTDLIIEADRILFDWEVGRHACMAAGMVEFVACLVLMNGEFVLKEFNTTTARLPVLPGKETGEAIIDQNIDVLEQWRTSLFGIGDTLEQRINMAASRAESRVNSTGFDVQEELDQYGETVKRNIDRAVDDFVADNYDRLRGPKGDPFTYSDFTPGQLEALRGPQGETISSIERTSGTGAAGTIDIYTVTTNAGKTYNLSVYNGADGNGAGDMIKSVYDPNNRNTDIFAYIDDKAVNPYLGDNPTGGVANDTVETWSDLDYGVAWISETEQLNGQPAQHGFILNYVHDTDVFQIFHDQTDGETYIRSGDSINAWFQNWRRVIVTNDEDAVSVYKDDTSMTMYPNGISDGNGKLWIDADGTAYFTEVYAGQKKLATEDYVNGVAKVPDDILRYTAQTLTEEQKTQVMTNLGIDTVISNAISETITALPSETWTLTMEDGTTSTITVVTKNA